MPRERAASAKRLRACYGPLGMAGTVAGFGVFAHSRSWLTSAALPIAPAATPAPLAPFFAPHIVAPLSAAMAVIPAPTTAAAAPGPSDAPQMFAASVAALRWNSTDTKPSRNIPQ